MTKTKTKTEADDNGNGNGNDKPSPNECPPGMKMVDGKCVPTAEAFGKHEDDNAGDTTQVGEPVGEEPPTTDTNPGADHECPPGSSWNDQANGGLGGCQPSGDPAGDIGGGGSGEPSTSGKGNGGTENKALTKGEFARFMGNYTKYFQEWQSNWAAFQKTQTEMLVKAIEKTSSPKSTASGVQLEADHMAFGVVKSESQKSSMVSDGNYKAVYEATVIEPATYFENVKKEKLKDLPASMIWEINVEAFLETLTKKTMAWGNASAIRSRTEMQAAARGEAITITAGDMPQIFAKQVYVIPGGRMRVPIRQFLDVQIIEDADRYNWYKIDSFDLDDTTAEGTEPTNEAQTVTKVTATPVLKRGVQTVNFSDIENAPFDLIEAFNRAAALGSISEEAKEVLDTTYDAITPSNWVNANTGAVLTADDVSGMTMRQEGIYAALDLIERQGGDTSPGNCVAFLHPKAVRELILDTAADFFTGQQPLSHRALGVLENRLGIDIVPTNKVAAQDNTTNDTFRNVLIVKGSIGLAVAADLQLEAQRRPDLSAVKVAARHRIKAAVIDETMTTRISSAQ